MISVKCPRCEGTGAVVDVPPKLSARQVEILALIASGMDHPKVARVLHLGLNTVYTHTGRIRRYLGVTSTADAVAKAQAWGVI